MLLTPHFLTGAAIAASTANMPLMVVGAIGSHFLLDVVPHRDKIGEDYVNIGNIAVRLLDVSATLVLALWLFGFDRYILLGGLLAVTPDLVELILRAFPRMAQSKPWSSFHRWHVHVLQAGNRRVNWFWGLLPQAILVGLIVYAFR